ncbi:MAG: radical SAM protein [Candidatus Omnitrophica bacterium]|nr:radical SAM protein [Candidatus Omnitrophota bacterium]
MRTILLNLPWRANNRWGVRAGSRWPFTSEAEENNYIKYIPFPFFLAYSASLLKSNNKDVKLIDAIAGRLDEQRVMDEIKAAGPGLIVIETSTPSFDNDIRLAYEIKRKNPYSRTALCGPHATTYAKDILGRHDYIDFILMGEYEYTLLSLAKELGGSGNLRPVLGLAYRDNEDILVNKPRPTIENLDDLPYPERQLPDIYRYNDGFAGLPVPNVQMWSSRGCPYQCIFCLWPQVMYGERKYRKRNPEDVVKEMERLIREFNFKAVYFDDDTFNIDKAHVLGICDGIKRRGIKIPWAAMARADLMEEELLRSMAGAGLYALKYGIESADSKVLKLCKKEMDLLHAEKMIKYTKDLGIKVHLTFCLGLPGETKQSIQESIDFIGRTKPDSLQFSLATPFPGTEFFRDLEGKGSLLSANWPDYDGNNKYICRTEELDALDLEKVKSFFSSGGRGL